MPENDKTCQSGFILNYFPLKIFLIIIMALAKDNFEIATYTVSIN